MTALPNFLQRKGSEEKSLGVLLLRLFGALTCILIYKCYLLSPLCSIALAVVRSFTENETVLYGARFFFADLLTYGVAIIILLLLIPREKPAYRHDYGFRWFEAIPYYFMMITVSVLAIYSGNFIVSLFSAPLSDPFSSVVPNGAAETICYALSLAIISPVCEEIVYRKLFLGALRKYGDFFAVVVSAMIFAGMHGNFYQFFNALSVGLVFGLLTVRSNSVIPAAILHIINNSLVVISVMSSGKTDALSVFFAKAYDIFTSMSFFIGIAAFATLLLLKRLKLHNDFSEVNTRRKLVLMITTPTALTSLFFFGVLFTK